MRNTNRPITSTEIETVIKKLPTNRSEFFTGEFYQTLRASTYPETLAKNYRGRNTPTFILWDHHHSDTKTRQIPTKKRKLQEFPGGPVIKNQSTCQCRGHRLDPWFRKILHAVGQLSPWATPAEPSLWNLQVSTTEATTVRSPRWRAAPAHYNHRKSCTQQWTHSAAQTNIL